MKALQEFGLSRRDDGDEYMNYKAFRRIYRFAGLQMGRRRRRGRAKIVRGRSLRRATRPFEGWTLDFVADRPFNGRAFRGLTMMDEFTRVDLTLELNYSFPSRSVIAILDDVAREFGYPKCIRVDNGTELTSKIMQAWSEEHCVELLFIQPGKPTQNAFIESFNARVRAEFLNAHWFRSLMEARSAAVESRHAYHTTHSHSALGYMTPEEFLAPYESTQTPTEITGRMTVPIPEATRNKQKLENHHDRPEDQQCVQNVDSNERRDVHE